MEALTDAIGLWALGLGARVIDVLDREVELVLVPLWIAAILAAAVSQRAGGGVLRAFCFQRLSLPQTQNG